MKLVIDRGATIKYLLTQVVNSCTITTIITKDSAHSKSRRGDETNNLFLSELVFGNARTKDFLFLGSRYVH